MPILFRVKGYSFFFYSNEGIPREPIHVHVRRGGDSAKIWLQPNISIADSFGFSSIELRELIEYVEIHASLIERNWHDYFDA